MKRRLARMTAVIFLVVSMLSVMSFGTSAEAIIEGWSDMANWSMAEGALPTAIDGGIMFNGGFSAFGKAKFLNEIFSFDAEFELTNWTSFAFRTIIYDVPGWALSKGENGHYSVVVKSDLLELQSNHPYAKSSIIRQKVENTYIKPNQKYHLEMSAVDEGSAVRLKFSIDGKEVFNYLETEFAYQKEGYFGVYAMKPKGVANGSNAINITNFKTLNPDGTVKAVASLERPAVSNSTPASEAFLDRANWSMAHGGNITPVENGMKFSSGFCGFRYPFLNETLSFDAEFDLLKGSWPLLTLRSTLANTTAWSGPPNGCYIFVIDEARGEDNDVIYLSSQFGGFDLYGQNARVTVPNTFINPKQKVHIELSAVNEGSGVRLKMIVDGKEVINYLEVDPVKAYQKEGYFTVWAFDPYYDSTSGQGELDSAVTITNFKAIPAEETETVKLDNDTKEDIAEEDIAEEDIAEEDIAEEDIVEEDIADEDIADEDIVEEDINIEATEEASEETVTKIEQPVTNPDTGAFVIPFILMAGLGSAGLVLARKKCREL